MIRKDLIIVGAGPAGLACANRLAGARDILIVERKRIGHRKSCAGLLSPRAWELLRTLDIPSDFFSSPRELELAVEIEGRALPPQGFFNIERGVFEDRLASSLAGRVSVREDCSAGVTVTRGGYALSLRGTDEEYWAPYLVVADGAGSGLRRFLGYPRAPLIGLRQCYLDRPCEGAHMVLSRAISPDYYYWLVPKGPSSLIGTAGNRERMTSVIEDCTKRHPRLAGARILRTEAAPVTRIASLEDVVLGGEGHFLIGEAAGLVLPSSGEGLTGAFESAFALAEAILRGTGDPHQAYAALLEGRLRVLALDLGRTSKNERGS